MTAETPLQYCERVLAEARKAMEEVTSLPWRAHGTDDIRAIDPDTDDSEWEGYAWVGYPSKHFDDGSGRFDGKIADLDRRKDGSPDWRKEAYPTACFIVLAAAAFPLFLDRIEASLEMIRVLSRRDCQEQAEALAVDLVAELAPVAAALKTHSINEGRDDCFHVTQAGAESVGYDLPKENRR